MTSRSASGEGESSKALMIHCSFGTTTSRARITATIIQFTTMRIRSTTYAIGSAADEEAGLDMNYHRLSYRISINYLSIVVKYGTGSSIKGTRCPATGPNGGMLG